MAVTRQDDFIPGLGAADEFGQLSLSLADGDFHGTILDHQMVQIKMDSYSILPAACRRGLRQHQRHRLVLALCGDWKNVDVSAFQNDRYRNIQAIVSRTGPVFVVLALLGGTYDLAKFGLNALWPTASPSITVNGAIAGQYTTTERRNFAFPHKDSDGNCDANRTSDKTWCLPAGWRVAEMGVRRISANCNSSIASPTASGDSCAFVSARDDVIV